jgi:hypothetical protein
MHSGGLEHHGEVTLDELAIIVKHPEGARKEIRERWIQLLEEEASKSGPAEA